MSFLRPRRLLGVASLCVLSIGLGAAAAPSNSPASASGEYLSPDGSEHGYPLYRIQDDGRHMPPQGTTSEGARAAVTLAFKGVRYYGYFTIPPHPADISLPLIVSIHGVNQTSAEPYTQMEPNGTARQYATLDVDGGSGSWNAGRCCGTASSQHFDSDGGISRLIEEFAYAHQYNRTRLYLAGFSNGGMMAYEMACRHPTRIAAIVVVAGAHMTPCRPSQPVPVLHIHGDADRAVPYNGTAYSKTFQTSFPSAKQSTDLWRGVNQKAGITTTLITLRGYSHGWPTASNAGRYDATGQAQTFLLKRHR